MELLKEMKNWPVTSVDGHIFLLNPISDGIPPCNPALVSEALHLLSNLSDFNCDAILGIEPGGVVLAAAISIDRGRSYTIARRKSYGLPKEICVPVQRPLFAGPLYVNLSKETRRVVIVDDFLASGRTLHEVASSVGGIGVSVVDILVLFERDDVRREFQSIGDLRPKSVAKINVNEHGAKVVNGS